MKSFSSARVLRDVGSLRPAGRTRSRCRWSGKPACRIAACSRGIFRARAISSVHRFSGTPVDALDVDGMGPGDVAVDRDRSDRIDGDEGLTPRHGVEDGREGRALTRWPPPKPGGAAGISPRRCGGRRARSPSEFIAPGAGTSRRQPPPSSLLLPDRLQQRLHVVGVCAPRPRGSVSSMRRVVGSSSPRYRIISE